jgi:hypothetical protein
MSAKRTYSVPHSVRIETRYYDDHMRLRAVRICIVCNLLSAHRPEWFDLCEALASLDATVNLADLQLLRRLIDTSYNGHRDADVWTLQHEPVDAEYKFVYYD